MLHIALFEPQIAPNTGNIIRLAANNGFKLHLIEPLGFSLDEKQVRRAGLDYHDIASLTIHKNYADFAKEVAGSRIIACTTRGARSHTDIQYQDGDVLLFGAETHGLSEDVHQQIPAEHKIRIPMVKTDNNRSLNLSNSVAIISYEAWRQLDFVGGE